MKTKTVNWALLADEAASGALGGLLLGLPGALLGRTLGAGANNGFGDLVGAILLAAAGYILGCVLGVYFVGRRAGQPGAVWAIALGSLAGGALTLLLAQPLRLNATPVLLQGTFLVLPPVLAAVAAHLTRRPR